MLYAALFLVFFVISKALARRRVWASGKAPSVGSTVPRIVNEIAAKLGVSVEVQPFGGTRGGEMEAVEIDGRRIVRVGTSRLREAKSAPQDFRFVVAHELTHLAAGDPRTDRIVSCAYATAATFMLVSFCSVLWEIADGLAKSLRFGPEAVIGTLKSSELVITTNAFAMGTFLILLLLERRSAMRLREFHADAVAVKIIGAPRSVMAKLQKSSSGTPRKFLTSLFGYHPELRARTEALAEVAIAFKADQLLFALQGYFAATIMEIALQMLVVNASPNVSTLDERRDYLLQSISRFPLSVVSIIAVATILIILSQTLALRRLGMVAANVRSGSAIRMWVPTLTLTSLGTALALLSSETFQWELRMSRWNLGGWIMKDSDRPLLYSALLIGTGISIAWLCADPNRRPAGLWSFVKALPPALCLLLTGLALYGPFL